MKTFISFALAASVASAGFVALSPADAAERCGRGYHRGAHGYCRPNAVRGHAVVAPGLVIGRFYTGRGYWDGRRYWKQHYRHNGGWRYR